MTIKELAYSAQQHIRATTGGSFKRAHVYELLAAAFGFSSHAAFGVDTVFTELRQKDRQVVPQSALIKRRCIELGHQPDIVTLASSALESFLVERQIDVASISSLVSRLRGESSIQDEDPEYGDNDLFDPSDEAFGPILLDGLAVAASKGNALAHYALALIYDHHEWDTGGSLRIGSSYWYKQEQQGRVLTGAKKEWAEAYKAGLQRTEKYTHHLREAGRLGHSEALLDLAERFDDPTFFEQSHPDIDADPAEIAAIAERMGRTSDAKLWLTVAAESGDTDAMLELIEEYDQNNLQKCWTWIYLSQLIGNDLTQADYYAINEDGSLYDDDVGGPLYAEGRDGVDLEPLSLAQDTAARLAARKLFEQIRQNAYVDGQIK